MNRQDKREDIHNRFTLALAERSAFVKKDSENYKVLSGVIKDILAEYTNGKHLRHGFRLYGAKYYAVNLQDNEII